LLPTIRSRCRTLQLEPLGAADLKAAALQAIAGYEDAKVPDPSDWPRLLELAGGSVRRLLAIASAGGLKVFDRVEAILRGLPKIEWAEAHTLSDELAGSAAEQKFEQFYDFLLGEIGRLVHEAASGEHQTGRTNSPLMAGPGRLTAFAEAWQAISEAKAQAMALNLDRKSLILDTIERLSNAANGRR
jgi:DNA polymerase III subunit delta'